MLKSYVKRAGRMTDAQRRSYETLFPRYGLPFTDTPLNVPDLFGNNNPLIVEIGFGMGVSTALIAEANPAFNYLGIEVHTPGIGRLLWEIKNRALENIRIVEYDAVDVVEKMLGDNSIDGFHIFFPDPWQKKRHHKRRLIQKPFTELLWAKLKQGAYIYMVTDWVEYGDWALVELSALPGLKNAYAGFAPRQLWRPQTKFEQKGLLKDREIRELYFLKQ
jgi:tRNA (guanine-N7-)-methyltransferase